MNDKESGDTQAQQVSVKSEPPISADLTRQQQSAMLYFESCAVDKAGVLDIRRINNEDRMALSEFERRGWLRDVGTGFQPVVLMYGPGWEVAARLRRERAERNGPGGDA